MYKYFGVQRFGLGIYEIHKDCLLSFLVGLPGEVALRICAIREMFEESGVLIARDRDQSQEMMAYMPGSISPAVMSMSEECASQWRNRIHINAKNFIAMCRFTQTANLCRHF